jgi:hypothetical protein
VVKGGNMYFGYNPDLDSPSFSKTPSIAVGQSINFDFLFKDTALEPASKYAPLNYLEVINNSQSQVILYIKNVQRTINQQGFLVLNPSDVQNGYYSFSIKNNGNYPINAGELIINVQRKGINGDTIIQRLISKFSLF